MGEPVRIVDLAEKMIRLSGKEPGTDVEITYVGPAPGEKLHEELWADGERPEATTHPKIFRCAVDPVDPAWLEDELADLEHADAGAPGRRADEEARNRAAHEIAP